MSDMLSQSLPKHVAIIMDGNGRWARQQGKPRWRGHQAGADAAGKIIQAAIDQHVDVLSLFAFSSENWCRPEEEVNYLMKLLLHMLKTQVKELHKKNVALYVAGDLSQFSAQICAHIKKAEALTHENTGLKLIVAVNYGGQWDIVQAAQRIAEQVATGVLTLDQVDEKLFSQYLVLSNISHPDLLIRTSGEQRISNFFLWQLAYAELYFTPILWPDFDEKAFQKALDEYAKRHRRFGGRM